MNLKLFFVLFTAALSAGCGLIHGVTSLSTSVALIPVAIGDGVLGTHMARSARNGVEEAFKEGKLMQSDDIKRELSNTTLYLDGRNAQIFIREDGEAISKDKDRLAKNKWTTSLGSLCISNINCYEIREKDNKLYCAEYIRFEKGDPEHFGYKLEEQTRQDDLKKLAEADKKRAEAEALEREQLADPLYEKASALSQALNCDEALQLDRLAQSQDGRKHSDNDQSDGYRISFKGCQERIVEAKCMATPKCRAKKEQEERQRQAEAQRQREYERAHQCDHIYAGRTFDAPGGVFQIVQTYQVIGYSSRTGKVTIRLPSGDTQETTCDAIPK
ncbi:MAG: hypothetical protein K9L60_13370 [Methylovulum sp.]|nr:hypothetical protein [Methylovulum sp.]